MMNDMKVTILLTTKCGTEVWEPDWDNEETEDFISANETNGCSAMYGDTNEAMRFTKEIIDNWRYAKFEEEED